MVRRSMKNQLISAYLDLILEANTKINLTAVTDRKSAWVLHVEDSLSALEDINDAPKGRYADLGTGGGFPGVPLAIMSKRETLLIDSVGKKVAVIQEALQRLSLDDYIHTYHGRIEDLSKIEPAQYSVVTARALSSLPALLELSSPLLSFGGRLICFKSKIFSEELSSLDEAEALLGMKLHRIHPVTLLSDKKLERNILVFEKVAPASVVLPRRSGKAQKKPLLLR